MCQCEARSVGRATSRQGAGWLRRVHHSDCALAVAEQKEAMADNKTNTPEAVQLAKLPDDTPSQADPRLLKATLNLSTL
jgi:hypothetical protein